MKNTKRPITCNCIRDGVLTRSIVENRVVYKDKKGEYIRSMGNKYYLTNDTYEQHAYSIRGYSAEEVLAKILGAVKNNG